MPPTRRSTRITQSSTPLLSAQLSSSKPTLKQVKPNGIKASTQPSRPSKAPAKPSRTKSKPLALSTPNLPNEPPAPTKPLPLFPHLSLPSNPSSLLPAVLSFSFIEAKDHLIKADPRFRKVFEKLRCRPFEDLEGVDPFRSLCTSIIGQQVSWLAARSINHKFRRLFIPTLGEKWDEGPQNDSFPSPADVLKLDTAHLRSAGLSGRKAEYVISLAEHFVSGKLSPEFLSTAPVEEVSKALIDVRGIGQWTVDMFLIFTLRRPDIMPVGDLGVQKGLLKWIIAAYESQATLSQPATNGNNAVKAHHDVAPEDEIDKLARAVTPPPADASSLIPASPVKPTQPASSNSTPTEPLPPPSTAIVFPPAEPSEQKNTGKEKKGLNRALFDWPTAIASRDVPDGGLRAVEECYPLGEGLTLRVLKERLSGKKVKGGAYLTPQEMEDLTVLWRPYRSLGVYYMWAVAEETS